MYCILNRCWSCLGPSCVQDVCVYEEIQRQEGMLSGNTDSGGSSPPVGAIVGGVVGGVGGVAVVVAVAVAFLIRHRRQEAALRMRYSHESAGEGAVRGADSGPGV